MVYTAPNPTDQEIAVHDRIEELRKQLSYAVSSGRWEGFLRRVTLARAIRGSNSIEGYSVTVEDAVAAVEGEEPLDATTETWSAIMGYRNAMTYVLQLADDPHFGHSNALVRSLHFMMVSYDLSKHPGQWRPGPIFVLDEAEQERVYEGPNAELVPGLMDELMERLSNPIQLHPVMIRAAMAHLNLVMIHPFSDGNGRMARCLQTLILARQGILSPHFCSIEEYLGRNTPAYYEVLGGVGRGAWHPENDARPWIRFCLTAHFRQALTLLRRTREMQHLWDELEREIVRAGLNQRVIPALADAAMGFRVRNSTYRMQAEINDDLASRDLRGLDAIGLLVARGERRGRVYVASKKLLDIRASVREPRTELEDPFASNLDVLLQPHQRQKYGQQQLPGLFPEAGT
jgi:Fic family protein